MNWINKNRVFTFSVAFALVVFLVHHFTPKSVIEFIYSQGVFIVIRFLLDYTIGFLPFSALPLVFLTLIFFLFRWIISLRKRSFLFILGDLTKRLIIFLSIGYSLFYVIWGFNYDRIAVVDHLNISDDGINDSVMINAFYQQIKILDMRSAHSFSENDFDFQEMESELRGQANELLHRLGIGIPTRLQCRHLHPKGILMRIATAGFYSPITGECNIDAGLYYLEKPFVMAHEIFHGLGIAGEGECNLLAYIICSNSSNPFIRYSGELELWRYLRRDIYRYNRELFLEYQTEVPDQVKIDIEEIRANNRKYPDIMPKVRNVVYDSYLKSNHIQSGLSDYNRLVKLAIAARSAGYLN